MNLREIRTKRGFTMKQVADAIGVSESAICLYESGKRQIPVKTAMKLGAMLKFNWALLYSNTGT